MYQLIQPCFLLLGNNIYVDSQIGSDTNIGTESNPLQTLEKALEKAVGSSSTIYLQSGQTFTLDNQFTLNNDLSIQ